MAAKKGGKKAAKKGGAKKGGAKKAAKAAKKPAAKKAAKKSGAKRVPNAAFMAPKQPDALLSAVVGNTPIPRTEITKRLWQYIKKNGLQDKTNKRMINADETLKTVFGGKKQVDMFEMTALVSKHLS
jgi:upstream activation factor subunit UAF30